MHEHISVLVILSMKNNYELVTTNAGNRAVLEHMVDQIAGRLKIQIVVVMPIRVIDTL
jgi:hypothetical protein